ncbi:MAG TPA: hypothetical protein VK604_19150 [Bryobacteraceae bacterium]|nr:hypothetical protein [Bryobacteraceae bacterium]
MWFITVDYRGSETWHAAKWFASLPRLEDFLWGVHANLSAGMHSKILRVFAIS